MQQKKAFQEKAGFMIHIPLSLLTWSAIGFRSPCNSGRKISAPAAPVQREMTRTSVFSGFLWKM